MKKISLFLAIVTLFSCLSCFAVFSATSNGVTFTAEEVYSTKTAIKNYPLTAEATVFFPSSFSASERGGVIIGNYKSNSIQCFSVEIHKNGNPRLYIIDADKTVHDFKFTNVNIYNGKLTHIAITADTANGSATCYIDGVAKQTIKKAIPTNVNLTEVMCLGGDLRSANGQYFKGSIKNVALFSDVRTADEIKADATATASSISKNNLIGFYEYNSTAKEFADMSGSKGPSFATEQLWVENKTPATNYAYSFAVVGDTQKLVYMTPDKIPVLYDWILNNVESKKIEYVIGLGDITDKDQTNEWNKVMNSIKKLDGVVPYSLIRGNHDTIDSFNRFIPYSKYKSTVSGSFEENMLNTYHKFTVDNIKYLLLNLDMGPSDAVLNWANKVVSENPDHNVIIATHVYLYHDGTTLSASDNAPATKCGGYNNGDDIWNKLVKKHENIVLVLSGHDPYDQVITTQAKGEKGNTVTQMLIDPQTTDKNNGGLGLVAMLYFSEDGKNVQLEYISTAYDKYFLDENQYSFTLDVVEATIPPETDNQTNNTEQPGNTEQTESTAPTTTDEQNKDIANDKSLTLWLLLIIPVVIVAAVVIYFVATKKKATDKKD